MQVHKLTPNQVHQVIQGIDLCLQDYDKTIPVTTIAEKLHINADELMEQIYTLKDLHYLRFAGHTNDKIVLTDNGRYTNAPIGF